MSDFILFLLLAIVLVGCLCGLLVYYILTKIPKSYSPIPKLEPLGVRFCSLTSLANLSQIPKTEFPSREGLHDTLNHRRQKGFSYAKSAEEIYRLCSDSWRDEMQKIGRSFLDQGVDRVVLVHGTFTGDDPFGFVNLWRDLLPQLPQSVFRLAKGAQKHSTNRIIQDLGNFCPLYVKLLQRSLNVPCCELIWSSANYHSARLEAAVKLLKALSHASRHSNERGKKILIGHSHAGQAFAIVAQLLWVYSQIDERSEVEPDHPMQSASKLLSIAKLDYGLVDEDLLLASALDLYFVTLGTPPRYWWPPKASERLLNIVNHRGHQLSIGSVNQALYTKSGDYIQKFAIAGSDLIAPTRAERQKNRKLDAILGPGYHPMVWKRACSQNNRPLNAGHTYLVDFEDEGANRINFSTTFFGHGTYTRINCMLPLQRLIAAHYFGYPLGN